MSFWTDLRDTVESAAVIAGNYFLPGSSIITSQLVSEGSKDQLNSSLGKAAQLASGSAAFLEGGPGLSNYGAAYDKAVSALNLSPSAGLTGQQALDAFNAGKISADEFAALAAGDSAAGGGLMGAVTGAGGGAAAGTLSKYLVPAAILGSSIVGAGAAKSAAQTQADAAREANALGYQIYQEQKALQEPFRQAGIGAQNKLLTYLGLPGGTEGAEYGKYAKDFGMSDFTADPGYAFRMSEGLKGLERSAAARGGLLSGTGLKNISRFGQDLASQEYQNAFNRYQVNRANQLNPLGSLLASGQSAAANVGTAAGQYGAAAGANITGAGAAQAAGNVGAANALTNALGSYLNYSSNQDLVNALTRRSAYGTPT